MPRPKTPSSPAPDPDPIVTALASLSDDELKARLEQLTAELRERLGPIEAERQRRADERDRAALDERRQLNKAIVDNAGWLLEFLNPEHSLHSCSDTERNSDLECPRCALLDAKDENYLDNEVRFSLSVKRNPLRNPDDPRKK